MEKLFQHTLSETFQQKCWVILSVEFPNPTSLDVKSETQLSCYLKNLPGAVPSDSQQVV